ncbi:MAG: tRNA (N(6)-L-threonylcarbamoyladenosine(37)-C(2))-methylthiotransferase MtaB [Myxococcales bacterium]|nr:MAG: tRNA (N(6)-L-threonylcarbamoyladenosine(37)-C(2))-methylthiotransferase MtaB [Myxococcales bacterium]
MTLRVAVATLGCKTNHYDTASWLGRLDPAVFEIVPFAGMADVYVVNSCTVTALADRQSRQAAYQAKRRNPEATVILAGCYATVETGSLTGSRVADRILPRGAPTDVVQALIDEARARGLSPLDVDHGPQFGSQTRPYLKIQDGCEAVCSYCIIPRARGPVKSAPADEVLRQLEALAEKGVQEVVLTGIHVGQWGKDLPGRPRFAELLRRIGDSRLVPRVRTSSLEPLELTDDVIDAVATSRSLCPHLHIPLQSGSDGVLERMRRPYRTRHFAERIERAARAIPDLGLGMDVIVGFPGETDAEFAETLAFVENLPFLYLHVFPFSVRPGTEAAGMPDPVPPDLRKARARELIEMGKKRRRRAAEAQIGKILSVLVEANRDSDTGLWTGFAPNYHEAAIDSAEPLGGRVVAVSAAGVYNQGHRIRGVLHR